MSLQEIEPDAQYCVYCHAPAAGTCASCGALCCGDCVELTMGLTRERAVCRECLGRGRLPGDRHLRRWIYVAAGLLAAIPFLLRACA